MNRLVCIFALACFLTRIHGTAAAGVFSVAADAISCGESAAKQKDADADSAAFNAHAGLHYNNDFSYLDDGQSPVYFGDRLKRLYQRDDRWLDIGGNLRLRLHDERGLGRQQGTVLLDDATSNPLLLQLRLYTDMRVNKSLRIFAEGIYADAVAGNSGYRARTNEVNRADFLNLFVDYKTSDDFKLRLGRQQIRYGSRRLLAGPAWANTSRSHDGAKLIYRADGFQIDTFYFHPVSIQPDQFDDVTDDRRLFGIWSTTTVADRLADVFYVGFEDTRPGRERLLHNIGGRIKGGSEWLYELEGIGQFGRQHARGLNHLAAMCVAGVGKKFEQLPGTPTLWSYFHFATGEDGAGNFNRYDRIFDRGHTYLGFVDTVLRSNIKVFALVCTIHPTKRVELLTRYYKVYAHKEQDVVRGLQGAIAPQRFDADNYGDILDVAAKIRISARMEARLGYSHFLPGTKLLSNNHASLFYAHWNLWF